MKKKGNPTVHQDLKGFDIKINTFGEMQSNLNIDKINTFLNDNVDDKKIETSNPLEEE